jgi:hypothetical protein
MSGQGYLHYRLAARWASIFLGLGHGLDEAVRVVLMSTGGDGLVAVGELFQADGTGGFFDRLLYYI